MTKESSNTEESEHVYLIYQTFIDSSKNRPEEAVVQALVRATTNKEVAESYCKDSATLTVEDCWALAFADNARVKEFNCQTIPLDTEIDVKGLIYD